jgi:hypothetical protein
LYRYVVVGWGEAQGLDIYGQCRQGARYLDLRGGALYKSNVVEGSISA